MRVAVNAEQLLYRSPGGIGRYTAQLLTVLPTLFPADEVVAFTAAHRRSVVQRAFESAGAPASAGDEAVVLRLPRPALYDAWTLAGWPPLPDMGGATLVHAPSVAVPPKGGRPLVVTVHDIAPALFPDAFPRRGRRFHERALHAVAARADLVVTVSRAAAEEIVAHSDVDRARVRIVPHGVAPPTPDPQAQRVVLERRGLSGRRYLLWVGSLEPRKGLPTLLGAVAAMRKRVASGSPLRDVLLVLAGYDGWLTGRALSAEDRSQVEPVLHQLGRVTEEELWALYAGATAFAFPSLHEGFGLPVLEAMSQGTPVVASDIPSVREVAGGAARLVRPGDVAGWTDALEQLLDDDHARMGLAEAGRRRSRELALDESMRRLHDVYTEALAGGG